MALLSDQKSESRTNLFGLCGFLARKRGFEPHGGTLFNAKKAHYKRLSGCSLNKK